MALVTNRRIQLQSITCLIVNAAILRFDILNKRIFVRWEVFQRIVDACQPQLLLPRDAELLLRDSVLENLDGSTACGFGLATSCFLNAVQRKVWKMSFSKGAQARKKASIPR